MVLLLALHHHRGEHRCVLGFLQRLGPPGQPKVHQVHDGASDYRGFETREWTRQKSKIVSFFFVGKHEKSAMCVCV